LTECPLVAHNSRFDRRMMEKMGFEVGEIEGDTMLAHHWLYPELPHDLGYLASTYFCIESCLHPPDWAEEPQRGYWNAMHAFYTRELWKELTWEMREQDMLKGFEEFVMPLARVVYDMGRRGVLIDKESLGQQKEQLEKELAELYEKLEEKAPAVNPRSPKQLQKLLYEDMKLPVQVNPDTGRPTTDETALEKLKSKDKTGIIEVLLQIRTLEKMKSLVEVKVDEDGRLRTSYNVAGTDTGRLSSSQTEEGTGTNLQNIPPWFRKCIIPDRGKVFVEADLEQAEARIVAWLAQDEEMMRIFETGGDIHRWNASRLFGKPEAEVTPDERYLAKRIVHAFDYGLGPKHAAEIIGCSLAEAKRHKEKYFRAFPKIVEWQRSIETGGRTLVTPFGRRRQFYGRENTDLVRKMLAYIPQSTCVDYANRGIIELSKVLPEDVELLLQTHDGFLLQCPPEKAEEVKVLIKQCVEKPIMVNGKELIIPVKIKVGNNWGEVKE